jgi:hypothetical protein
MAENLVWSGVWNLAWGWVVVGWVVGWGVVGRESGMWHGFVVWVVARILVRIWSGFGLDLARICVYAFRPQK